MSPQTRNKAIASWFQRWSATEACTVETRRVAGNTDSVRRSMAEFIALAPNVILATGSLTFGPLLQATGTIPIVFAIVPDPVTAHPQQIELADEITEYDRAVAGHLI